MIKAEVYITFKKTVADPQGLTIKHALQSLGYNDVVDVRMGKLIIITVDCSEKKEAEDKINQMCKKLLANPVIEDYHFVIIDSNVVEKMM